MGTVRPNGDLGRAIIGMHHVGRGAGRALRMVTVSALTVGALLLSTNPAFAASNLPLGVDPTYQANGRVNAIVTIGDMVYVGGQFTAVRPAGAPANTAW